MKTEKLEKKIGCILIDKKENIIRTHTNSNVLRKNNEHRNLKTSAKSRLIIAKVHIVYKFTGEV